MNVTFKICLTFLQNFFKNLQRVIFFLPSWITVNKSILSFYFNYETYSQIYHLAAVNLTVKSVSSIISYRHKRSQLILVFLVIATEVGKMQNLWLPPKSPQSIWYSVRKCLHQFYKFICVLQVSEIKKRDSYIFW